MVRTRHISVMMCATVLLIAFVLARADYVSPCESITSAFVAETNAAANGEAGWSGWLNPEGLIPGRKGPERLTGVAAAKLACEFNMACKWTGGPHWRSKGKCVRAENKCDGVDGYHKERKCNSHDGCKCEGRRCKKCVASGDLLNLDYINTMRQEADTSIDREIAYACVPGACALGAVGCAAAVDTAIASLGTAIPLAVAACGGMTACLVDQVTSGSCTGKAVCSSPLFNIEAPLCAFISDGDFGKMCKLCGWTPEKCPSCNTPCQGALFGLPTPWPVSGCPVGCGASCRGKDDKKAKCCQ